MPLNDTPCPRCGTRYHLMAGVNVLPQFPEHTFLVCWKCRIVKHTSQRSTWKPIAEAKRIEAPEKEADE